MVFKQYGPLPSLQGSELRAPLLQVVYNGAALRSQELRIRCPYQPGIRSTLDMGLLLGCSRGWVSLED